MLLEGKRYDEADFDRQHYFCCCSNCIIEIRKKYSIEKKFADGKHDECLDEIDTYFNERIERENKRTVRFSSLGPL